MRKGIKMRTEFAAALLVLALAFVVGIFIGAGL